MMSIQRVLSFPFSLLRSRARERKRKIQDQKASEQQFRIAAEPKESRRFRLEKECSNYRSIHFPR